MVGTYGGVRNDSLSGILAVGLQPKLKWDYCHGLELQSMLDVYDRYGNRKIYDYALAYADTMVNADGTIKMYKREEYSLDRINSGKLYSASMNRRKMRNIRKRLH